MELTPARQAQFPNSTQDCWDALTSGLRCLEGFNGKGNGLCSTHAKVELKSIMEGNAPRWN